MIDKIKALKAKISALEEENFYLSLKIRRYANLSVEGMEQKIEENKKLIDQYGSELFELIFVRRIL